MSNKMREVIHNWRTCSNDKITKAIDIATVTLFPAIMGYGIYMIGHVQGSAEAYDNTTKMLNEITEEVINQGD